MYRSFYGLAERPFSITPDPRYLFLGDRHAEALAHLLYGVKEAGGFIQLTGEVGTGKTTIIRSLLAKQPANVEIALVLNPRMNTAEFLLTICEELTIMVPDDAIGSIKDLVDILNRYLLKAHAAGRRVVLVVDEAQNLQPELLEQVRLLTNLETETQKLLQIILIGQPELREMLARNDLRQLAQRVTGRYHLDPLSREESAAYVKHRLRIAGATMDIFTAGALAELHRNSGGIPRLINIIADRALLGGYSADRHLLTAAMVRTAAGEVFDRRIYPAWLPWLIGALSAVVAASTGFAAWLLLAREPAAKPTAATAAAAVPLVATTPLASAAAPPPAAPVDLNSLLQQSAAVTDLDGAYKRLFELWGARYVAGSEDACSQALRQGLQCLAQSGGLDALQRFNRPALLALETTDGAVHQTVLTRLGAHDAQIQIGPMSHTLSLADLQKHWTQGFQLLWKPTQLDTRSLSLGMTGEPVRALRAQLNLWAGLPAENQPLELFDGSLTRMVKEFQRRNGLVADGVAGAETQALLDSALASINSPLLSPLAAPP
jgi:general secretion pathway protein A